MAISWKKWTDAELECLCEMYIDKSSSIYNIAKALDRTPTSIQSQIQYMRRTGKFELWQNAKASGAARVRLRRPKRTKAQLERKIPEHLQKHFMLFLQRMHKPDSKYREI